jgi:hypothetical protein
MPGLAACSENLAVWAERDADRAALAGFGQG